MFDFDLEIRLTTLPFPCPEHYKIDFDHKQCLLHIYTVLTHNPKQKDNDFKATIVKLKIVIIQVTILIIFWSMFKVVCM